MIKKGVMLLFSLVLFIFMISFVSADFEGCWSSTGATEESCLAVSGCQWDTSDSDPWCDSDIGCCTEVGCMDYDGTNQTACETNNGAMNCTWDPYFVMIFPNRTQSAPGGCMGDFASGGDWGGMSEGCWQYEGDQSSCNAQSSSCRWVANGQNQDPWCPIKTLSDAQNRNTDATTTDIGCCETSGCWIHDNNETNCQGAFQENCYYTNNTYGGGWCQTKSCNEITTEANCTYAQQNLMQPCNWDGVCTSGSYGTGGFGFYNDTDSC